MSSRNITAEREKRRQAVSRGAGCLPRSRLLQSCGLLWKVPGKPERREGTGLGRVRGHFSSPGQSSGRCDEESGGEGAEPGDAERPVCLGMLPISEDSFGHKCQKGHLTSFKPVRNVLDYLRELDPIPFR